MCWGIRLPYENIMDVVGPNPFSKMLSMVTKPDLPEFTKKSRMIQ